MVVVDPDALNTMVEQVRRRVRAQAEDPAPSPADFCAWGLTMTQLIDTLDTLARVLDHQVGHYGDRRILSDDTGADPAQRVLEVQDRLHALWMALRTARSAASAYASTVGHLGVEVDPDATP